MASVIITKSIIRTKHKIRSESLLVMWKLEYKESVNSFFFMIFLDLNIYISIRDIEFKKDNLIIFIKYGDIGILKKKHKIGTY